MTHLEIERLVRRITDLLQGAGNTAAGPKLAEDFAAACRAVNVRLQQCEAMIRAGDHHQAIQHAETPPNLLDVVTALEFLHADAWRAHCGQQGWAVADPIDGRSVQSLNACYERGINTDHPLYATFRAATLTRDDEAALRAVQSIHRLNPGDTNAASELARLEAKVLGIRLANLDRLLRGATAEMVVAEVETIESLGFKARPEGDVWRRAQALRCGVLLEEGEQLRVAGAWQAALARVELIRRLSTGVPCELTAAGQARFDLLATWTAAEQERDRRDQEFRRLLSELDRQIQASEEKDTSARSVPLAEMKSDCESLHRVWRRLADFTRPIPEAATAGFRKRIGLLEAEIYRRTRLRQRAMLAGLALVLVAAVVSGWIAFGRFRARDFAEQLNAAVKARQVGAAEKLIERTRQEGDRLRSAGAVNTALAAAESFVVKERGLFTNYTTAFQLLPTEFKGEPEPTELARLAGQLETARMRWEALAPDLKTEVTPKFEAYQQRWQKFLTERGAVVNSLLAEWVADGETQAASLDYRQELEEARPGIAALAATLRQIRTAVVGFTNRLQLRADLLRRAEAVENRFAAFDREFKKLDEGHEAMRKARSIAEYLEALKSMSASEFSSARVARAARMAAALEPSDTGALRTLLAATNPATWAFIQDAQANGFIPRAVMPAELERLDKLRTNPAVVGDHHHLRLWLDPQGSNVVEWITVGGLDTAGGWKKIKAFAPGETPGVGAFTDHEYGGFDGRLKLSASQPVYRVEELPLPPAAARLSEFGLTEIMPTEAGGYRKPLLDVLDNLKVSREGSPVFRAYLFQQVVGWMELQPHAWGLAFCPALRGDARKLAALTGAPLQSGDWFVAGRGRKDPAKFETFFADARAANYGQQASNVLALCRAAVKAGFRYAGFADFNGNLVLAQSGGARELWGYDATNKRPERLRNAQPAAAAPQALPLTPLFTLPQSLHELASGAGVDLADPSLRGALPPLFVEGANTAKQ